VVAVSFEDALAPFAVKFAMENLLPRSTLPPVMAATTSQPSAESARRFDSDPRLTILSLLLLCPALLSPCSLAKPCRAESLFVLH
jgi:hypothetical protein